MTAVDDELAFCHRRREQARELLRRSLEEIDRQTARMNELINEKADGRKVWRRGEATAAEVAPTQGRLPT